MNKISSCKSLLIHPPKSGQPNSLHPSKFILLNNKSFQIDPTKHTLKGKGGMNVREKGEGKREKREGRERRRRERGERKRKKRERKEI